MYIIFMMGRVITTFPAVPGQTDRRIAGHISNPNAMHHAVHHVSHTSFIDIVYGQLTHLLARRLASQHTAASRAIRMAAATTAQAALVGINPQQARAHRSERLDRRDGGSRRATDAELRLLGGLQVCQVHAEVL